MGIPGKMWTRESQFFDKETQIFSLSCFRMSKNDTRTVKYDRYKRTTIPVIRNAVSAAYDIPVEKNVIWQLITHQG